MASPKRSGRFEKVPSLYKLKDDSRQFQSFSDNPFSKSDPDSDNDSKKLDANKKIVKN